MKPQDIIKKIGNKDVEIKDMTAYNPRTGFRMMVLKPGRHLKDKVYFSPCGGFTGCRETASGYVRRARCGHISYVSLYSNKEVYGGYARTTIRNVKVNSCFSDTKPMCMLISGITKAKAEKAKVLLNELEAYTDLGETEILDVTMVGEKINTRYTHLKAFKKKGVVFVIPTFWTQSIPHLSLYLLIVRSCARKLTPKKGEDFFTFWKRFSKQKTPDGTKVKHILDTFPELPVLMVKRRRTIARAMQGVYWGGIFSSNGVTKLLKQVTYYNKPRRLRKESIASARRNYSFGIVQGHRKLVALLSRYKTTADKARKAK